MLKTVTTNISDVKKSDRLEPDFWIIGNFIDSVLKHHKHQQLNGYSKFIRKGIFDMKAERYQTQGIPFLRISNLKYFELSTEDLVYITDEDNKLNSKTILRHGDIAFSKIGTLGKLLRVGKRFSEVNLSQNLIGVGLKQETNKNYIFAFLLSKLALLQIKKNKKKQLQDKLNLDDIKEIEVVELPDNKIKVISDLVENAEIKAEKALSLIEEAKNVFYKKIGIDFSKIKKEKTFSVNIKEFTKDNIWNPAYSYPLYVNTLKIIKEKWQTVLLGKIATVKKGNETGSDCYSKYLDKKDNDIPFIRTSDIVNYEADQFPDFYIPEEIYQELKQDITAGDVLFNNDGKIGLVAMLTQQDRVILQSHIKRIRLKKDAIEKYNFTQEYIFLVLTINEVARYQADRYTVIQSTIPTISNHILDFEIPIIDKNTIEEITKIVKESFKLKDEKKKLIKEARNEIDSYFDI